jgi:hypothetical protein
METNDGRYCFVTKDSRVKEWEKLPEWERSVDYSLYVKHLRKLDGKAVWTLEELNSVLDTKEYTIDE